MTERQRGETPSVLTGIDVLARDGFALLHGAMVGLITNHTGLTNSGVSTIDVLHAAEGVTLKALFGPEHGIRGEVDEEFGDGTDARTGLPVYSLYEGQRREPKPEQLAGIDTLVFDIQDVGTRFYTYLSTLGHCLAAAQNKLRFVVLDRPNPITGNGVEGPLADETRLSFTAFHPIPIRHGMTLGEMAMLLVAERDLKVDLIVVKCEGWKRADWFDTTGLLWTNPSPNLRSLTAALTYPGVALLEFTNFSVGRGTDTPFEIMGAPYVDPLAFAYILNTKNLPGVRFIPTRFTPSASKFAGEVCGGVQVLLTDRSKFIPVKTGLEIALALRLLYLEQWEASRYLTLLANRSAMDGLLAGEEYPKLAKRWTADLRDFNQSRAAFLLYE